MNPWSKRWSFFPLIYVIWRVCSRNGNATIMKCRTRVKEDSPATRWWPGTRPCRRSSCWWQPLWAYRTPAPSTWWRTTPGWAWGSRPAWARHWWSGTQPPWGSSSPASWTWIKIHPIIMNMCQTTNIKKNIESSSYRENGLVMTKTTHWRKIEGSQHITWGGRSGHSAKQRSSEWRRRTRRLSWREPWRWRSNFLSCGGALAMEEELNWGFMGEDGLFKLRTWVDKHYI